MLLQADCAVRPGCRPTPPPPPPGRSAPDLWNRFLGDVVSVTDYLSEHCFRLRWRFIGGRPLPRTLSPPGTPQASGRVGVIFARARNAVIC